MSDTQASGGGPAGGLVAGRVRLAEVQQAGSLAVFPLIADGAGRRSGAGGPSYITLREALADGTVVVSEVSAGGSVPDLSFVNKGDQRVLALEGEELRGAKQNRVLNTTLLVDRHSSLVVPVSCTEQGRWSYDVPQFSDSAVVAERRVRYAMKASTSASLRTGGGHRSDQGRVWDEVAGVHERHGTSSPTAAMRDAYESKRADLDEVLGAFPLADGQCGLLVVHGGRAVGLEFVSQPSRYALVHDRLLRSYALEVLVGGGDGEVDRGVAEAFLERLSALPGERFKSPALGWDIRLDGEGLVGSVLTYHRQPVHASVFDVGGVTGQSSSGGVSEGGARGREPRLQAVAQRFADAAERARQRRGIGRDATTTDD